jgi:hypothetical protein
MTVTQNQSTSVNIVNVTTACTTFGCATDTVNGTPPTLTLSGLNSGNTYKVLLTLTGSAYAGTQDTSTAMSFACSVACTVNGVSVAANGGGSDAYSLAFARITAVSTSPMSASITFLVTVTGTSSITFTGKFKTGAKSGVTVTWPYSSIMAAVVG